MTVQSALSASLTVQTTDIKNPFSYGFRLQKWVNLTFLKNLIIAICIFAVGEIPNFIRLLAVIEKNEIFPFLVNR